MYSETISLHEAEQLTGLPSGLIRALTECGEVPAESIGGNLYIGKGALLGWCKLFAKVLAAIVGRHSCSQVGGSLSARNLVWLAQSGLLTGRERIRL